MSPFRKQIFRQEIGSVRIPLIDVGFDGAAEGIRTPDPRITSAALYP